MMKNPMTLCAVGDIFLSRPFPEQPYGGLETLSGFLRGHDVRFGNLETTIHHGEATPSAVSGGTWSCCPPKALDDLGVYGFNLYNMANNHALDYSRDGLEATMSHLESRNLLYAGVGRNLSQASAPVYLDCVEGRVALVAATANYFPSWVAGGQKHDMQGRSGVNPLGFSKKYTVTPAQFQALEEIAQDVGLNAEWDLLVSEGFEHGNPDILNFGGHHFTQGDRIKSEERLHQGDLDRILASIRDARSNADYVFLSIHSHQLGQGKKDCPADFLQDFARRCVDAGASVVLGHGPHLLRGIESYKNGVIFYSLGNFLFQNDTVAKMPWDFMNKYGLDPNATVQEAMSCRSRNGTIGLAVDPKVWHSVVASVTLGDGKPQKVTLHPITLRMDLPVYRRGLPSFSQEEAPLRELQTLSSPFGTTISIEDGLGVLRF